MMTVRNYTLTRHEVEQQRERELERLVVETTPGLVFSTYGEMVLRGEV